MINFVEELTWRGMIQDIMPGTEKKLMEGPQAAYVGIDPTADSLHIGHLVSVMILKHFQRCGHKPIALVGGATGMIGDPSMKSAERNLLDEETLTHNVACLKAQLARFLDFDSDAPNKAELVNNYDWMKDYSFINFIRDIGKHITVNYMMAKDSVKKRLSRDSSEGMSFTEFSYQLMQGYDFYWLWKHKGCILQLGGSDQWGNITTGTELIRRMDGGEAFALTCPLIRKADGTKFGKTEKGNIWLDAERTSPYEFYQFWMNVADDDAERYIKIFTMLDRKTIEDLTPEGPGPRSNRHGPRTAGLRQGRRGFPDALQWQFRGPSLAGREDLPGRLRRRAFVRCSPFRTALRHPGPAGRQNRHLPLQGRSPQDGSGQRREPEQGQGNGYRLPDWREGYRKRPL